MGRERTTAQERETSTDTSDTNEGGAATHPNEPN